MVGPGDRLKFYIGSLRDLRHAFGQIGHDLVVAGSDDEDRHVDPLRQKARGILRDVRPVIGEEGFCRRLRIRTVDEAGNVQDVVRPGGSRPLEELRQVLATVRDRSALVFGSSVAGASKAAPFTTSAGSPLR